MSLRMAETFDIAGAKDRLAAGDGGYEIVHRSAGLEIGVYVLVAPEPDRQSPHEVELREGHAVFVPAGAEHRFVGYEQLSVLVIFEKGRP
jgi:hypothetical protein